MAAPVSGASSPVIKTECEDPLAMHDEYVHNEVEGIQEQEVQVKVEIEPDEIPSTLLDAAVSHPIKIEPYEDSVFEEVQDIKAEEMNPVDVQSLLYSDHDVKTEMVIGPTEICCPEIGLVHGQPVAAAATMDVQDETPSLLIPTHNRSTNKGGRPPKRRRGRVPGQTQPSRFSCDQCGKGFIQMKYLYVHIRAEHGEKKYPCQQCDQRFSTRSRLLVHENVHDKPFTCDQCEKRYASESNLKEHLRIHSGTLPYSCDECGKKFNHKSNLTRHQHVHTGILYTQNRRIFRGRVAENSPCLPSTGTLPFSCSVCSKEFNHISNLGRHLIVHTGDRPFTCDQCDKQFSQKSSLILHLRVHGNRTTHPCNLCDKRFTKKAILVEHQRVHSGEKPFSCSHCKKRFTQRSSLSSHIKSVHIVEQEFHCDQCGKQFSLKCNFVRHLIVHTGEQRFSCDECGKRYSYRSSLLLHLRRHRGDKPFSCNLCDKRFTRNAELVKHQRVHGDKKLKKPTHL